MSKTILQHLRFTCLLCLLSLPIFQSCKNEIVRAKAIPEAVKAYVYAYTAGVISKASPVRISFAGAAITDEKVGSEANGIFNFTPSVSGTAIWENTHTVRFEPKEVWKSGTAYVAKVSLDKVFDNLPKEAESFEFDFLVREQSLGLEVYGIEAADPADLSKQLLKGVITTNDMVVNEDLEKTLTIKQNGKSLTVEWSHENNYTHVFIASGVTRGDKASEVELSVNGKSVDVDFKDTQVVPVPALGDFTVTSARVVDSENQYIVLHFSDPLMASQNLDGLIGIQGLKDADANEATEEEPYYDEYSFQSIRLSFTIDGNNINVYPSRRLAGIQKIEVRPGIRNLNNQAMEKPSLWQLGFEQLKPKVRLVGRGVILPSSDKGLILPFEAISLQAVEVEIFKIYDNNILQFLQTNDMDGTDSYELNRVGRVIRQEMVPLKGLNPNAKSNAWTRYALDLGKLFKADPNAIYQVRIGFKPEYATYKCSNRTGKDGNLKTLSAASSLDEAGEIISFWGDYYGIEGYYDGWNWQQRENPCYPAYYNYENFAQTNVFASDLGITAKRGKDGSMFVVVADLRTTKAVGGVELELYDYQKQLLTTAKTNGEGIAELVLDKPPFLIIAKKEKQKGYLKTSDGNSLSLSRFDVSGTVAQKGLKGFIYGERGVWRPGDSLFLNFVLEDKAGTLPSNYPIAFELKDSRGQIQYKTVTTKNLENVYALPVATSPEAPTGNWMATARAGGAVFEKVIKVETVKPNRLKINLDFGAKEELTSRSEPITVDMQVDWLHGVPGQNLRTNVEMEMRQVKTEFPKFKGYQFDDPARALYPEPVTIFDGTTNNTGHARFQKMLYNKAIPAPGKLQANFRARAFEKGGDFSIWNTKIAYSPYPSYVGVHVPESQYGGKELDLGKENTIKFAAVDEKGSPISNRSLNIGLYKVEWRWWWEQANDYVSQYNSSSHFNALQTANVSTTGDGTVSWKIAPDQWGRYLVRVCDTQSGHCAGEFFNAGYPWYGDDNNLAHRKEAAMMTFTASKAKYKVGEDIQIKVPAGDAGQVLITLETGTKVIKSFWKQAKKGENTFEFEATEDMAPTVYASVSLIQPHGQTNNDLPIRMYGVLAIPVENPETILKPVIKMPDELKPLQEFTIEVSEANNETMAYTLAVVDEGLLGLTNFKTPDPHGAMYAREALGVKTWDLYDYVLGAYGGELERILSIGGDAQINAPSERKNANRFKPVVMNVGPYIIKGGKKTHKLKMPNYVGSVRVMVVAANKDAAYGNAEKIVAVKKPLMALATLPRVLGPGETLKMPVSIFAMDKKVKNVDITLSETTGIVKITGGTSKQLTFAQPGESMAYFDLSVGEKVGIAKFKVTAKGGGETASQDIELDVRNPNPVVTDVHAGILQPGEKWTASYKSIGTSGTNSGILEVSSMPPLNLGQRLSYLLQYPHGCIEQTVSAAFPQLFVNKMIKLDDKQGTLASGHVAAAIDKLKNFQVASGGFAYWPGGDADGWGTNYAGHFLLEAQNTGYNVPQSIIDRFISYQQRAAKQWDPRNRGEGGNSYLELEQAYRLYTLALARKPETGSMNRMRELKTVSNEARWRLAAAYALTGKEEIGKEIIRGASVTVQPYVEMGYSYGSGLRDEAMILETQVLLGNLTDAAANARHVAEQLGAEVWYSTQTTAYSLLALGKFLGKSKAGDEFTFTYDIGNGKVVNAGSSTPVMQIDIPVEKQNEGSIAVTNTGKGVLFTRVILQGQPVVGDATAAANHLNIELNFRTISGDRLEPDNIPQGTDFIAEVVVSHPGTRVAHFKNMALSQIFPSGWEIINTRMSDFTEFSNTTLPAYQDIRDDRVYTYFDIQRNARHVYRVRLNAAYQGRYYLPSVSCEAMYDNTVNARKPGKWVNVVGDRAL